jgi:hypothetical protein
MLQLVTDSKLARKKLPRVKWGKFQAVLPMAVKNAGSSIENSQSSEPLPMDIFTHLVPDSYSQSPLRLPL